MKTGWLIVNPFLQGEKYASLYALLLQEGKKRGISLAIKRTDELIHVIGERIPAPPEFVIFWDKDTYLAESIESQKIPLFNNVRAIALCDDKAKTALSLTASNVPTPKTVLAPKTFDTVGYNDLSFLEEAENLLAYPMVIKENYGSFGAQVYLAKTHAEAVNIILQLKHKPFIMQEYIAKSHGKDLRVNVVGEKVVCSILRENTQDFRSNISGGGKAKEYILSDEQAKIALDACKAVGADFAGVDILFGDTPLVCEVNSNPHFKSTLDCTGVDLSAYIFTHIEEKLS